jgi:hypothetical protein
MRDNLRDFEGTLEEGAELLDAQRSIRAWLISNSRWGRPEPEVAEPVINDQPGIEKEETVVTPQPSSKEPRYGIGSTGKKSHHKDPPAPDRKCLWDGCEVMIGGNWLRCPEHSRAWHAGFNKRKRAAV